MGWILEFYRRVGQTELVIEELDPFFARQPRFTREPQREVDPLAEHEVCFFYVNPISRVEFAFTFQTPPEAEEEDLGRADFSFEATALRLELPLLQHPETAQEAIPIVEEICLQLDVLVRDPQREQELPARPDAAVLIRSYLGWNQEAQETLAYLEDRRARYLRTALALVGAVVILGILLLLGGR